MSVPYYFVPLPAFLLPRVSEMSKAELAVVLTVCSKTIPWGKASDIISYSQFATATGLCLQAIADGIHKAIEDGIIKREPVDNSYRYSLIIPDQERRVSLPQGDDQQAALYAIETQKKDVTRDIKESEIVDNSSNVQMLETINEEILETGAGAPLQNLPWLAAQAAAQGLREGDIWELWRACRDSGLKARVGFFIKAVCGDGRGPQQPIQRPRRGKRQGKRSRAHAAFYEELRASG